MVSRNNNLTEKLTHKPVNECMGEPSHEEVRGITSKINTYCPGINIQLIKSVKNSFLEAMYMLKKAEVRHCYNRQPREELLIHATSGANAAFIIKDNFDWRRVTRSRFGLGTSFTDDPEYANRFANYNIGTNRVFIITKVLVTRFTWGKKGQIIPPRDFDTTTGNNMKVYVKYHDNEMLPLYVVYYTWGQGQQLVSPLSATSGTTAGRLNVQRDLPTVNRNPNHVKAQAPNVPVQNRYPGHQLIPTINQSIPQPSIYSRHNTFPDSPVHSSTQAQNRSVCCWGIFENFGLLLLFIFVVAIFLWILKNTK